MTDDDEIRDVAGDADAELVGAPRWVKVCGLIAAGVLIAIAVVLLTGAGGHGVGRHSQVERDVRLLSGGSAAVDAGGSPVGSAGAHPTRRM